MRPGQIPIRLTVTARPGEEAAPPSAPVITAEPQPVETPSGAPAPQPTPRRPTPQATTRAGGAAPTPRPAPVTSPSSARRTRVEIVVPQGGTQEVKIVVIDETGVHTAYRAAHAPGDRIEQMVQSKGYTVIQVYIDNRLVQELRP
jgi:hypothetical protein